MSLETVVYINDLNISNPTSTDPKSEGDDHIRNIKSALKATFPNVTGPVNPVNQTSPTGAVTMPSGTTGQRDASPEFGYARANSSTNQMEWWNGSAWTTMGGGATGGGTDAAFVENDSVITQNWTVGQNAMMSGVTVTINTPGLFTLANHGFVAEQKVRLTTTGALPTGLNTISEYYVIAAGLTTSTFQLSLTIGGSGINTTGTQSGVHSVGKIKNASTAGPVSIATGVTVTTPTGSTWTIV